MMFTTDLALKFDPEYRKISKRFYEHPEEFEQAFALAWFKLTHRDMGPRSRLLGKEVPAPQLWQDPVPDRDFALVNAVDIEALKREVLKSGASIPELVKLAWASASSYRDTDMRGGANGARIRLLPQRDWEVNQPAELARVLPLLEQLAKKFNGTHGQRKISLADVIVLAGSAAVEQAAKNAGFEIEVSFAPGRTDATQETTDATSFAVLEPHADGFRNYYGTGNERSAAELLIDKADFLTLTAPEMTVLVGGMRTLGANYDNSKLGVFTNKPGTLSNDFFVNLLDMSVEFRPSKESKQIYEGVDRKTGELKWKGSSIDLVFGSNAQLRAISEVYASDDAGQKFVSDFATAWSKVMMLDRFDIVAN
jgi:catalase-peroxidase